MSALGKRSCTALKIASLVLTISSMGMVRATSTTIEVNIVAPAGLRRIERIASTP